MTRTACLIGAALVVAATLQAAEPGRPNVLVILADDLGFSDLGCYGGEIDTPHLDALATGGLRFTQGYSTARCWPSRAALLTGYYPQAVKRDSLPGGGDGGMKGVRPAWARLLPQLLAPAGYQSYHSGKWHVDGDPREQGFARSLLVDAAAQSNYFTTQQTTEDGRPVPEAPDSYITTVIGGHAVRCLREHAARHKGVPFFHYVAFTAPHFPLHAPADLVAKYRDRYRAGWDAVRAARIERLATHGIVTTPVGEMERGVGSPRTLEQLREKLGPDEVGWPVPWAELTAGQQAFQAEKMAIHAAMVEAMDREVGRIIAELKSTGLFDDTFILFASDNGASAEMLIRGEGHDPAAPPGSRKTFLCLGPGWSSCANAPFRRHKMWVHEGGIATPWIVHWPKGGMAAGALRRQMVHLVDVTPTVLALAGVDQPLEHAGRPVPPMHGRSFVRVLHDGDAPPVHDDLWWCHGDNRAVRVGDWKLVADRGKPWELYDLAADRCETKDLAAAEPDRVRILEVRWQAIADECRRLAAAPAKPPPNVVIIFCDDLGYGDPSCYGGKVPTPHIDRIAREGIRFTDFHVPHPVCSASRAALLTGCYSPRVSIHGALFPASTHGLAAGETTLAELLRGRGYRTACVGKWHLGHLPEFLPTRHGFDEWLGLPYSNDMWPVNPGRSDWPPLPLFDGEQVIDADVTAEDQATLTGRYTARAVDFIERAAIAGDARPFFLYLAHTMPHVPLFVGEPFRGKSGAGVYGDVVAEIDASVGAVLGALDRTGQANNTLVVFTSDNGPWLQYGNHGGSAGPLREGKATVFEGGIREPCVARLPGVVPAGTVSDALLATIDILPTVAALTGEPLPLDQDGFRTVAGKRIDGHERRGAFAATETPAVSDAITQWYFFKTGELQAVRRGRWKLLLPHTAGMMAGQEPGRDGRSGRPVPLKVGGELYDLRSDVAERHDVAAAHPEIVAELERVAEAARAELGDALTGRKGTGVRPPGGAVASPPPQPAAGASQSSAGPPGRRPNIIYVMTDDQGYGDIAALGNPVIRTPNLDRLHAQSVRFTEFHASPTCSPTRAALFTGRHEFRSGVTHTIFERERLALSATTLPELMRSSGYTTGIFGKWHLGDEDDYQPGRRGFDRVFIHGGGGIGQSYPGSCGDAPGNAYFDPFVRSDGTFVKTKGYCTDVFFTGALEWIDACRRREEPFFCYVAPNAPHDPLDCPVGSDEPYLARLEAAGIKDPAQRATIAKFYGMIENIDTNMGRLLAKLDEWGIAENTLVVFTTDNGTATGADVFNDRMRGRKGSPWRGGTRVPAFWRWPGTLPAGVDVPAVVAHIDVLPTLCELTATQVPQAVAAKVEGRSLVPLLRDAKAPWADRMLVTHVGRWDGGRAAEAALRNCRVREGRWSLVNVKNDPSGWELYDLVSDPGESRSVAASHPEIVRRLTAAYAEWWQSVQPDLVNEDHDGPAENPFKTAFERQFATGARTRPPSVLVIVSDDQRADTIHALGNEAIRTPALDSIVARGTVFDRAYCMGSLTGAVCVPSRAMLLSGRSLFHVDANLRGCDTWPERFEQAGYRTFVTGKWHNGPESLRRCFAEGEAVFLGGMHDQWSVPTLSFREHGEPAADERRGVHSSELFGKAAERFVERLGDEPFFAWVSFTAPHDPRQAPDDYRGRWKNREPSPPANFLPEHPFDNGELEIRDELTLPRPRTRAEISHALADYYACVEAMDDRIGRIVRALEEKGRLADTIILFTSDHGLALGSHGLLGKQNLYEHSMRSPAILAGPGVPAGTRVEALAYLFDLTATVGDLAGVNPPEGNEGRSLTAVMRGKEPRIRDALLLAYKNVQRALVTPDWKFIDYPQAGRVQLFDLATDPAERHDLSGEVAEATRLASLRDRLAAALLHARSVSSASPGR